MFLYSISEGAGLVVFCLMLLLIAVAITNQRTVWVQKARALPRYTRKQKQGEKGDDTLQLAREEVNRQQQKKKIKKKKRMKNCLQHDRRPDERFEKLAAETAGSAATGVAISTGVPVTFFPEKKKDETVGQWVALLREQRNEITEAN